MNFLNLFYHFSFQNKSKKENKKVLTKIRMRSIKELLASYNIEC